MKKLTKNLRDKSIKELIKAEQDLRKTIGKMMLEGKTNPPKDTNSLFKKRKELAATLTILAEKKELEKIKSK